MKDFFKYHISVTTCFMKLAIQRQLEYPAFLICWAIGIPIQYLSGVWMIGVITQRFQPLNGWSFPQVAFIYGLSLLSHGLMVVLFIQTWNIEGMVIRGGFDRLLLRPMNVFYQFCVQYFNFIGLIDLITGIIIFTYGCKVSGFNWTLMNAVKILLVLAGAVMIRAAFYTITGSIAFWTKSSRSFVNLGEVLSERTTMYPLSIYPYAIQVFFTFVIPFGFISFYPASEFLGQSDLLVLPFGFALLTPVVGALLAIVAAKVFKMGLKKYESAGS